MGRVGRADGAENRVEGSKRGGTAEGPSAAEHVHVSAPSIDRVAGSLQPEVGFPPPVGQEYNPGRSLGTDAGAAFS